MKFLIIIYCLLFSLQITAQTHQIVDENNDSSSVINPDDKIYRLFIEDKTREIRHLFKVNLISLTPVSLNFGYEQKLGRNWSSDTYIYLANPIYNYLSYETYKHFREFGVKPYALGFGLSQDIKLYYNLERRERLGKRYKGFSGNYFGLRFGVHYSGYVIRYDDDSSSDIGDLKSVDIILMYGLQRRIGNIGYVEIITGIGGAYLYSRTNQNTNPEINEELMIRGPFIGYRAGFAIDSFKNLRRMLKD